MTYLWLFIHLYLFAESLKIRHGNLIDRSTATIEVPVIGDENSRNEISLEIVHSIIIARVEETLMLLTKSFNKSGLKEHIGHKCGIDWRYDKVERH